MTTDAMTSDYQRGASAGREMVANFVLGDVRAASLERGKLYETILALPLPADPASREGAPDFATWREAYDDFLVQDEANRAEITIARCNLLFLEECCRYSLGLAGDLIGDALTKAVGNKVIAMRDEAVTLRSSWLHEARVYKADLAKADAQIATLRAALEKAKGTLTKIGNGHIREFNSAVMAANETLSSLKAPTP